MKYYVYVYLDPRKEKFSKNGLEFDYEPFYVGKGSTRRSKQHLWEAKTSSSHTWNQFKKNKINKIIKSGLKPIIVKIKEFDNEQEALNYEIELIKSIGRYPDGPLTNMTNGGDGISGYKHTKEWKEKLSKWNKEHPLSKEVRDRICAASPKGKDHPHYGTHRSEETKQKIRDKVSGKNNRMYGRKLSDKEKEIQSNRSYVWN